MSSYRTIGILGGMGPEATAELYLRIIRLFQRESGAVLDEDFPEILIISLPLPDVVKTHADDVRIRTMLVGAAQRLVAAGAELIAIPCNTVMRHQEQLRRSVNIPILNIIDETTGEIRRQGYLRVGLLATDSTVREGLYATALPGASLIVPSEQRQEQVTQSILNIMAGKKRGSDVRRLNGIIEEFKRQGAEKVILGCTELPLLLRDCADAIDSLAVLARRTYESAAEGDEKRR